MARRRFLRRCRRRVRGPVDGAGTPDRFAYAPAHERCRPGSQFLADLLRLAKGRDRRLRLNPASHDPGDVLATHLNRVPRRADNPPVGSGASSCNSEHVEAQAQFSAILAVQALGIEPVRDLLSPLPASTDATSVLPVWMPSGLLVQVDAGDDLDDQDQRDQPVDGGAERRPPPRVDDVLAACCQ